MVYVATFVELALAALGVVIFLNPEQTGRLVATTLMKLPSPVQALYRTMNVGHPYDSPFWATYYRYAGAALAVLAVGLWLFTPHGSAR